MKSMPLTFPDVAMIAGTRGMLGAGIGLLLADRVPAERRKAIGWTLLVVGALTTVPIAANLFSKRRAGAVKEESR